MSAHLPYHKRVSTFYTPFEDPHARTGYTPLNAMIELRKNYNMPSPSAGRNSMSRYACERFEQVLAHARWLHQTSSSDPYHKIREAIRIYDHVRDWHYRMHVNGMLSNSAVAGWNV